MARIEKPENGDGKLNEISLGNKAIVQSHRNLGLSDTAHLSDQTTIRYRISNRQTNKIFERTNTAMFPTRVLLTQRVYKAKKTWPPDFSLLSPKHQFQLERRYRRRMKLKFARPRLQKAVKLAQGVLISTVVFWGVFINDWGERGNRPVQPIRDWVSDLRKSFWSTPSRPELSKKPQTPSSSGSISEASGR